MTFAAGVFTVNDSWFATRKHRYVSNFRFDNNSTLVGEGDFKLFQGASIYVVPDANLVVRGSGTFFNTNWERCCRRCGLGCDKGCGGKHCCGRESCETNQNYYEMEMKKLHTSILLITFNRPEHTRRVLETIMVAQPQDLYVFQDGARDGNENDLKKCVEVRQGVEDLTKGSAVRVHTYFSERNLGCGPGPAAALTWFFGQNDMGIVLEDDAVPHPDFFPYCEELLLRYKDDPEVWAIGSMKIAQEKKYGDGSYYFSMMNRNLCAWATWRRAWQSFDIGLENVSRKKLGRALKKYGCGWLERSYWCDRLDEVHENLCGGNSWDMQFFMSIWLNHGKGIIPNVNLSSNIGTVGDATHGMAKGNIIENLPVEGVLPLVHPTSVEVQHDADKQFHFAYFEYAKRTWGSGKICYYVVNKTLKRLMGHRGPWIKRNR